MSTITEKMQRNAKKYRERIEGIRRNWTLSDEAKRQDLEAAYSEAKSAHARLADEYRASVREGLQTTRKAAFSAPKVGKDPAFDMLVYRDALERASHTTDQRTLSDMLERAEVTGDAPLARAVLYRGYELQSEGLVHSYFEKHPDELPTWEAFTEAAEQHNTLEALGITGAAGVPEPERPQELGRQFSYSAAPGSAAHGEQE
jgi:hypothetical protein